MSSFTEICQPIVTMGFLLILFIFVYSYSQRNLPHIPCTTIYKIEPTEIEVGYAEQYRDFLRREDPWSKTNPSEIMMHPVLESIEERRYQI